MAKNKYRLTKIKRNGKRVYKKIENGDVTFYHDKNKNKDNCDFNLFEDYIKPIQINGRLNGYLKVTKEQEKMTEGFKAKKERIDRVKKAMEGESEEGKDRYNNQYYNSIPLSISYYTNDIKKAIYEKKKELINSKEYLSFIGNIYSNIINNEILSMEVNSNNYLIRKLKKNRDEYLKEIHNIEDDFNRHFSYHMVKKVYKRLTFLIRKKVKYKTKGKNGKKYIEKVKVSKIIENYSELDLKNIQEYLLNQFIMNTIDINKNSNESKNSIDLEIRRQEDVFYKKIALSITQFQQQLVSEIELKHSMSNEFSIDSLGGNNVILKDKKILENQVSEDSGKEKYKLFYEEIVYKFFLDKKYEEVVLEIKEKLSEKWNLAEESEINNNLNNIVEIRSRVIHGNSRGNLSTSIEEKEVICDALIQKDKEIYIKAIEEKYLSNNVNKYFEQSEIEKIIKQSLSNEFEFIYINYMPRFSKILKRNRYIQDKDQGFVYWEYKVNDEIRNNSIDFLLKEIYYNDFRKYINSINIDVEIMDKIKKIYLDNENGVSPNLDILLGEDKDSKHYEEYSLISKEITKGNYEEIMSIWEIYIVAIFNKYLIQCNYIYLLEDSLEKEQIYNFKDLNIEMNEKEYNKLSKLFYLLSKGLNRRELNELMNSFKSYIQFLESKEINNNAIASVEELKEVYNVLNISLELLNRKINPLAKNQSIEMTKEDEVILKVLLENHYDTELYLQGNDKFIEYKFFNFLKEDNIYLIYNNLFLNIVKHDYITSYENISKELETKQKEVSEEIMGIKNILKKSKKKDYKKNAPSDELIQKYNYNLEANFKVNTVRFYTLYKLSNFVNEVYSLYVRTIKNIESDFLLILNKKDKNFSEEEKKELKKYIDSKSVGIYFKYRDEIAHYNYFNDAKCERSLSYYYKRLFEALKYNFKRKKSLREALEYIFSKYNIEFRVVNEQFEYNAMSHQFAYKDEAENSSWKQLKLISNTEVNIFKDSFERDIN